MEINELIQNFINEIDPIPTEEEYGPITEDFNFRDFEGWDSLTALCIQAMIENKYRVTITNPEIRNAQTFKDLFELIKTKKG
jgi:acyl carrier protein